MDARCSGALSSDESHYGTAGDTRGVRSAPQKEPALMFTLAKTIISTGAAAALALGSVPKPAAADTQSTITSLLNAPAVVGGLVLYNDYQRKRQAANSVVGYTANGGTVYGDGRITMPNGQTFSPNANGAYPWGQQAYYDSRASGYTYDPERTGRYDRTHHHGHAYGHMNDAHVDGQAHAYGHGNGNNGNHGKGNNGHHDDQHGGDDHHNAP